MAYAKGTNVSVEKTKAEQEFLPNIVLASGRTVAQDIIPKLEAVKAGKNVPLLGTSA